jgi:sporulation protein YlmC with PRC-barrel domain
MLISDHGGQRIAATAIDERGHNMTLQDQERSALVASNRIEGTPVFGADGKRIGKIERLMIEKRTGKVGYAVLSFGGFLGIGAHHYPIPWSLLTYNKELGGYQVSLAEEQLKNAPKLGPDEMLDQSGRPAVDDHWGVTYPWPPE